MLPRLAIAAGALLAAVTIALAAWPDRAPTTGSFAASDPLLERIWASSVETARALVTEQVDMPGHCPLPEGMKAILDGIERDRCVFIGDLAVTGKTLLVADGSSPPIIRDTLRVFAAEQHESGVIQPTTGASREHLLADYTGYFVEVLYDYVLHSGDLDTGRELYPNLVRALDRWYPSQMRDGLVANDERRNDFALIDRLDSFVAYYNAQYVRALDLGAAVADWIGESAAARRWRARARALRPVVHAAFWDESVSAYRDTVNGPVVHPQDGNAFAVLAGVASREQAVAALDYLAARNAYGYGNSIADNDTWAGFPWGEQAMLRVYPFMSFFEVLARYHAGLDDSALDLIRRCWGYMVENGPGTTWETIGPFGGGPVHGSWAHGWSSGAAPALTAYVLGVRPTSPGFATFVVDPRPSGLAWARGSVPTPKGPIEVEWSVEWDGLHVDVDAPAGTRWENEAAFPRAA